MNINLKIKSHDMMWLYDLFSYRPEINEGTYLKDAIQIKYLGSEESSEGVFVDINLVKPVDMPIEELANFVDHDILKWGQNELFTEKMEKVSNDEFIAYFRLKEEGV